MKNIAVIGAGTMGNGIAHVFAQKGFCVSLIDLSDSALEKAKTTISKNLGRMVAKEKISEKDKSDTLANIMTFTNMAEGLKNVELVVEAATENIDLKLKIFKNLDELTSSEVILATNTSSISITKIASVTNRPDKVIGMHFMNPVPIMKLVEIIRGYSTSDEVTQKIMSVSKSLGKVPVEVNDYPGFIANRILMPMINEAIETLRQNVAGVEDIDSVMCLGMAHPMGPLKLADLIGLDVCKAILEVLRDEFNDKKYDPSPLLIKMVNEGKLGRKTKQGFYNYNKNK